MMLVATVGMSRCINMRVVPGRSLGTTLLERPARIMQANLYHFVAMVCVDRHERHDLCRKTVRWVGNGYRSACIGLRQGGRFAVEGCGFAAKGEVAGPKACVLWI